MIRVIIIFNMIKNDNVIIKTKTMKDDGYRDNNYDKFLLFNSGSLFYDAVTNNII
jgi:hypothetical protein